MRLIRWLVLTLSVVVLFTPIAFADSIQVNDIVIITWAPNHSAEGGVFIVTAKSGAYQFPTFCLERDEYLDPGSEYLVVSIQNSAEAGGMAPSPHPDPLDWRTCKLYAAFLDGTLPGYDGSNAAQTALQDVIWYIEQEWGWNPAWGAGSLQQQFLDWSADASSDYGVLALNLNDMAGNRAQSVLVRTPEPATLALLGLGLTALAWLRRKRAQS